MPARHSIVSTWAIATRPQHGAIWPEAAFIWEASDPYLYMRATKDGRVICGGEDEDFTDEDKARRADRHEDEGDRGEAEGAHARDRPHPGFRLDRLLRHHLHRTSDHRQGAGPVAHPCRDGLWGHGITFSQIASEVIATPPERRQGRRFRPVPVRRLRRLHCVGVPGAKSVSRDANEVSAEKRRPACSAVSTSSSSSSSSSSSWCFLPHQDCAAGLELHGRALRQVHPHPVAGPEPDRAVHRPHRREDEHDGAGSRRADAGGHHPRQRHRRGRRAWRSTRS